MPVLHQPHEAADLGSHDGDLAGEALAVVRPRRFALLFSPPLLEGRFDAVLKARMLEALAHGRDQRVQASGRQSEAAPIFAQGPGERVTRSAAARG